MDFRDAVLRSNEEAQRNVAPFLRTRALRAVIWTFRNDANGDFGKWATNPLVLRMLSEMQTALDEGRASEEEIERFMVNYLSDSKNDGHDAFKRRTTREANLETKDLVGALNEQCELRYKGNAHYERREFAEARECYAQRARDHESRQGQEPVRRRRVLQKPRGVPPQPRRRVHGPQALRRSDRALIRVLARVARRHAHLVSSRSRLRRSRRFRRRRARLRRRVSAWIRATPSPTTSSRVFAPRVAATASVRARPVALDVSIVTILKSFHIAASREFFAPRRSASVGPSHP